MSKFLIHRVADVINGRHTGPVSPGLEAAIYAHWTTLYDSDPVKHVALEEALVPMRIELHDYLTLTAAETAAHLELCESLHRGAPDVIGTKDFAGAEPDTEAPGRIARLNANFGLNWGLFYWDAPTDGGQPWGYRLYRSTRSVRGEAPELIHTSWQAEALVLQQPQRVKFYYHVTAFNGAGECQASPCFGLMYDAPEEEGE
jgi:hypothetical protein